MTTWSAADPRFGSILAVARRLDTLCGESVFLGGAVLPLLITDAGAANARPTDDVDLAVDATTRLDYHKLGERLRGLGFAEDDSPGAPICRWVIDGVKVDVMPTEERVLGYSNRWFLAALRSASLVAFDDGQVLRVITAPCFVATKLEGFADRGKGDYRVSHDMEDVVAIVDGRVELLTELSMAAPDIREYVAATVRTLLDDRAFVDVIPGHLPPDEASQMRFPALLDRLRGIAGLV